MSSDKNFNTQTKIKIQNLQCRFERLEVLNVFLSLELKIIKHGTSCCISALCKFFVFVFLADTIIIKQWNDVETPICFGS